MAITTTTNKSLVKVTVGTESGTWGPYINGNEDALDNMLGGTATVALTNAPVVLSSGQYQCSFIRFTGAITADVPITFPSVGSFYTVINDTTNSSNFCVTLATTTAGSQAIGLPSGAVTDIMTDSANVRFRGLPHVGTYWDYSGSSVPRWVSACTVPPWLLCDGSTFAVATYPALSVIHNGGVLPDARGRMRMALDAGAGRVSSGVSGVAGNTLFGTGGDQSMQQHNHTANSSVNDAGHIHNVIINTNAPGAGGGQGGGVGSVLVSSFVQTALTGITVATSIANTGTGGSQNMPPVYAGGITMVRAG